MSQSGVTPRLMLCGCAVVAALTCSVALGQGFGPEMYGMVARFGMGTPVTTRVLGMGGFISCVNDEQFANPAFAAVQDHMSASVRLCRTDFDAGPRLDSILGHVTYPLTPNKKGLQLSVIGLETSQENAMLAGLGPATVDMSETALVVDYGQRFSRRLTGGLSVLGFENVDLTIASALGPVMVDVEDSAQWGFRGGLAYEWAPGDFVGLLFSFSRDDVDFATPAAPVPLSFEFDSSQLCLGVSRHLAPNVLLAAEYQHGATRRTGSTSKADTWNFGTECTVAPGWNLRLGANDFDFCWGAGYDSDRWRVDYACINGWNASDVSQLLGGSTTHSVAALYRW
jgi:hypothetical protein